MRTEAGVWIDHRRAVVALVDGPDIVLQEVTRKRGNDAVGRGDGEDGHASQLAEHLDRYYDDVIARLKSAGSILIMGPGEAKVELESRLDSAAMGGRIVGIETADQMTDGQIKARVRDRFLKPLGTPNEAR